MFKSFREQTDVDNIVTMSCYVHKPLNQEHINVAGT